MTSEGLVYIGIVGFFLGAIGFWWVRNNGLPFRPTSDELILPPLYSGDQPPVHVQAGEMEGFKYVVMAHVDAPLMIFVTLNQWASLHMVAFGDKSRAGFISGVCAKVLEPAVLEGDFPDYFQMYCRPEDQMTLREVFDPADMAYFADFCLVMSFEIYGKTLYFSQADGTHDENDPTSILQDVQTFLKRNKRTFSRL